MQPLSLPEKKLEIFIRDRYYNTELKRECYIRDYNSDNYMSVNSKGKYEYQEESNVERCV